MRTFQLGWCGDNGLGARLCRQVLDGVKSATCSMKASYGAGELEADIAGIGELHLLQDGDECIWGIVRLIEIVETTFGTPDPRLVEGEGNGADAATFQADHVHVWDSELTAAGWPGTRDIPLIAYLFELVEARDPEVVNDGA